MSPNSIIRLGAEMSQTAGSRAIFCAPPAGGGGARRGEPIAVCRVPFESPQDG